MVRILITFSFIFIIPFFSTAQVNSLNPVDIKAQKIGNLQQEQNTFFLNIDSTEIAKEMVQTTADLLQASGQVMVQKSQQGGGSPILRGFEANKIVLVIDNVRMNNAIYRGGHLQNIITIDPFILENMEVVMGQGSTMYGSDALGGVIRMQSRRAAFSDSNTVTGNAFIKYASANNGGTFHTDFSIHRSHYASITSVSVNNFGDLKMGNTGKYVNEIAPRYYYVKSIGDSDVIVSNANKLKQVASGYQQLDLMHKSDWKGRKGQLNEINLQYSHSSDIPRYDRLTDVSSGRLKFAEWYYGPQDRLLTSYQYKKNNVWIFDELQSITSFQHILESRYSRKFNSKSLTSNKERVNVYSQTINGIIRKNNGFWRTGLDFQLNNVKSIGFIKNIGNNTESVIQSRYPSGKNIMWNLSIYAMREWHLPRQVVINAGLRTGYNQLYSGLSADTFYSFGQGNYIQKNGLYSFDFNIKKGWTPQWITSLNVGTGYRVPNLDDLSKIFESSPGILIIPNQSLKPEKTINLNANIDYSNVKGYYFQMSPFVSWVSDAIVTLPTTYYGMDSIIYMGQNSALMSNQNAQKALLLGFNTSFKAKIFERWYLLHQLSYTYGRVTSKSGDTPLDHIPPVTGRLTVEYEAEQWGIEGYVLFNGAKKLKNYSTSGEDNLNYAPRDPNTGMPIGMPAWVTLNVKSNISLGKRWQANLGIENILNTRYQVFASGIVSPGRNFIASLKYVW